MLMLHAFILWHLAPLAIAVINALIARQWRTAALIFAGWLAGIAVGFLSVWLSMELAVARGGADPGNAGVMFFCSIPICTILCMTLGGACGYTLDNPRKPDRPAEPVCPRCGYSLRGLAHNRCPECGHATATTDTTHL